MTGAHEAEVPTVEGGDPRCFQALGGGDHGGVDGPEREVAIGRNELGDSNHVPGFEGLGEELTVDQGAEEAEFSSGSESRSSKVRHFGDAQDRDMERVRR